ncbi:MAG: cobaltochelatase subunit CobN [Victivallis sp.]
MKTLHFFTGNYLSKAHARAKEALVNPEKFEKDAGRSGTPAGPSAGNVRFLRRYAQDDGVRQAARRPRGSAGDGRRDAADGRSDEAAASRRPAARDGNAGPYAAAGAETGTGPEEITFRAKADLLKSTEAELASIVNAFNGGYLYPSPGGDPVLNPDTVPTGKNLYGIDPERTPTRESYAVGRQLAEALIQAKLKSTGEYPKKVGFSLWGGEFIRLPGTNIGEIFYLLGVEPVWDSRGRVQDVKLIPASELGAVARASTSSSRPPASSGEPRPAACGLMEQAVRLAQRPIRTENSATSSAKARLKSSRR